MIKFICLLEFGHIRIMLHYYIFAHFAKVVFGSSKALQKWELHIFFSEKHAWETTNQIASQITCAKLNGSQHFCEHNQPTICL